MSYAFSTLPSTQRAKKFRVRDPKTKAEAFFTIEKEVLGFWGNPLEAKVEQFMIGYLKKNGWPKEPVEVTPKNTAKDLTSLIAGFSKAPKK